jgi:winged helix DNA-binding protein
MAGASRAVAPTSRHTSTRSTRNDWGRVLAFRLERQHLTRASRAGSLEQVAHDCCGLQAQAMPATELSFWARTEGLLAQDLDRALWHDRRLARTWCMRGTLHVIPASETPLFMAGCRRAESGFNPAMLRYFKLAQDEVVAVVDAIGQVLAGGRLLTRKQLAAEAEALVGPRFHEQLHSGWGSFLKPAAWRGLLICGPPQGQQVTFVHASHWLGGWDSVDPNAARVELVRRYLHAFGPATRADFERWAGMLPPLARPAWAECQPEMAEVQVEGKKLWALADDATAIRETEPSEEVRLVPNFDSYLLGHADRSAMVAQEHSPRIYRPAAWVWATVLKGGRAVGIWNSKRNARTWTVEVEEFAPLGRLDRQAVRDEVEGMAAFLQLRPELSFTG